MLISTIDEIRQYAPVSRDLNFKSIEPAVRKAERRFIIPLLGVDFHTELKLDYEGGTLDAAQTQLLGYIRSASVPLALWYYVQIGGVQIDDSGIYKTRTDQRWNLGDREQKTLETSYLFEGLEALDDLMNYLADKIVEFPDYADSKEFKAERLSLVPSASMVQGLFNMLYPRVTFRAMREGIRYHEQERIAPIMQGYYANLVAKKESELDEDDKVLLPVARRALIYLATARALLTRSVKFTNEGLQVMIGENGSVTPSENSRIEAAVKEYEKSGEATLQSLVKLLNQLQPDGYTAPVVDPAPVACQESSGFILF
ncbi:MAG: DUF6712 family protein [Dyadobacter sp.]|uniref:DUF6712 family protein n=1 Tax=Dyadobacter sp. TaxID=1914288 RepID=UPI0032656207